MDKRNTLTKMDLLLRAMAKAKGIDPDQANLDNKQDKKIIDAKEKMKEWNEKEKQSVAEMQKQPVNWEEIYKYVAAAGGVRMSGRNKF